MNQYLIYKTLQGDTFDSISLDFYDDEYLAHEIIKANPDYCKVILFEEGIELKIPILSKQENTILPPWKR